MKFRCKPYNPVSLFPLLGFLLLCNSMDAAGQCTGEFIFKAEASERNSDSGKIEIVLKDRDPGTYTFKVYKMEGTIPLVRSEQASSPESISIEGLPPATYFVKIEWGTSCYRTIGGLEGIVITEKAQLR